MYIVETVGGWLAIPYKDCIKDVSQSCSNKIDNNSSSNSTNIKNEKTNLFYGIEDATRAILDFVSDADT